MHLHNRLGPRGLTLVFSLALTGCLSEKSSLPATTLLVTSTQELRLLLEPIVAKNVRVEALAAIRSDGHEFEYSAKHLSLLKSANYIVGNGMGLDSAWLKKGLQSAGKSSAKDSVFWMSECVKTPIESHDHEKHHHVHAEGNPHWIFDPGLTTQLWNCLSSGVPAEQAKLFDNQKLKAASAEQQRQLEKLTVQLGPMKGMRVVSLHRQLSYFFKRFGIVEVVPEGVNEIEQLRPALLKELQAMYLKKQIDALAITAEFNPRLADQIRALMPKLRVFNINIANPHEGYPTSLHIAFERLGQSLMGGANPGLTKTGNE
jgi:ABC-type Zn uptake system ZnuABC Zn-binding protein ZnuA